MQLELSN
ncbi:rCG49791 [Rattus norvegicus]|nr:rCG49791 [Rattus norvegicus]